MDCSIKKLIIDEAGLITHLDLITLILQYRGIDNLFLTSDNEQLPSYTGALPEAAITLWHESCINNLISRRAIFQIALRRSNRSHPVLIQIISTVLYNGELVPALNHQERTLWKELKFPPLYDETPILFLDVPGAEFCTPLFSWMNSQQLEAARLIYHRLKDVTSGKIVVLCYYSSSVYDLRKEDLRLPVYTVDSFMGKGADLIVLLTTRTTTRLQEETGRFLFDWQRQTLALTRAREGMFILGSQLVLSNSSLWTSLINELDNRLKPVTLDEFVNFCKTYRRTVHYRLAGVL